MRILAFDPGHTTGIAFVDNSETRLVTVVAAQYMTDAFVLGLLNNFNPDLAVIEGIPSQDGESITVKLFHSLQYIMKNAGVTVQVVQPGIWKPVSPKPDLKWAIHGADALGLARYAARISEGKANESWVWGA